MTTTAYNLTFGSVQKIVSSGGNTTQFVYDSAGDRVQAVDANNHVTKDAYDTFRRMVNETTPLGHVTKYVYDAAGNVVSKTEPNGSLLPYSYDALNRLVRTTYPGGSTQTTAYDADGNAVETKGFDLDEFYVYDALDRVVQTRQVFLDTALTVWHNYTYDADGSRVTMDGPGGGTYTWDANNRIRSETDAVGNRWTYAYGRDGQLLKEVFPDGGYVTYGYDSNGRLTQESDYASTGALFQSITYTYDAGGRRSTVASFNTASLSQINVETSTFANTTKLTVSGLSPSPQSVTVSVFASLSLSAPNYVPPCPTTQDTWSYLLNGVVLGNYTLNPSTGTSKVCQRLFTATYSTTVSVKDGDLLQGQIVFENDAIVTTTLNYLSVSYRSNQGTTMYVYDRESRLIKVTNADGSVVQYTYDAVGNRLTYTSGGTIYYTYNADNELTTSSDGTTYGFDSNGDTVSRSFSGVTKYYGYGYDGQPTTIRTTQTLSSTSDVSCNQNRNICTTTVTVPTLSPNPQTDAVLVTAGASLEDDVDGVSNCPAVTMYWEYLLNGNVVQVGSQVVQLQGTMYHPCIATVRGATYSGSATLHTGDTLAGTIALSNRNVYFVAGTVEMSVTITVPVEAISYGPDGTLAAIWTPGTMPIQHYGYDLLGMGGLPQRVAAYNGTTPAASYFYGLGSDRPLDLIVGGVSYFYHRDGLDSTTALTDASGDTVASYRYDAYGNLASGSSDAVHNPLRFDAMASDPTSGLVYDRARMYDPTTGRFLTPDSMGGGYAFAGDSPTNNVDPSGMMYAYSGGGGVGQSSGMFTAGSQGMALVDLPGSNAVGASSHSGETGLSLACYASMGLFVASLIFSLIGIASDFEPLADAIYESHSVLPTDTLSILVHGSVFDQLGLIVDIIGLFFMNVIGPMLGLWGTIEAGVRVATLATPAGVVATAVFFAATFALGIYSVVSTCQGS